MGSARIIGLVPALAALALLTGCRDDGRPQPPQASQTPALDPIVVRPGDPLIIGVSAHLTGDAQTLGTDLVAAAELAAGQFGPSIKGHDIELSARDDGCSDAERAVAVATEFITQRALVGVIGPMCTTGAQAANPRYEAAGVVHISASATRSALSSQGERYFFRTAWHDDAQAAVQAAYAREELGASTAVVVDDGEPYGNALAAEFSTQFQERGGRVLATMRLARGTVEFASIARQIIELAPDLVVFEGFNPEGALMISALREAGFQGFFAGPDGLLSVRDFIGTAGSHADGAMITGGAMPDASFLATYVALYQRPPVTQFVLQTHDAVTALLRAIEAVAAEQEDGTLRIDRLALAEALRNQRFAGLTGSVSFDERGERRGETASEIGITVYRVFNGQFVAVE